MGTDKRDNVTLKRVDRLNPGMVVGRDIHSSAGTRLLSEGDVLSSQDIQRLQDWNKRCIHVKDPDGNSPNNDHTSSNFRQAS